MKYLICLMLLFLPNLTYAQDNTLPIAPCMPSQATMLELDWLDGEEPEQRKTSKFYELSGIPIEWLGYPPDGQEALAWYGEVYGFQGINMFEYGQGAIIELYNGKELVGRIEVQAYHDEWLLFFTSTEMFTDENGKHPGYHTPFYPGMHDTVDCMFRVRNRDFLRSIGRKNY